ncbi:MAG: GAF domain-containing protein, partial [Betaproteobacteria bacterium]
MTSIREWLETKGLGKYAESFAKNEIDFDVLPMLTEADLDKLGLSVGARRRLALAVKSRKSAKLSGESPPGLEKRLEECERKLNQALERQAASDETLEAISNDPGNVQAVVDAVAVTSARLCAANGVAIAQREGDTYRRIAYFASNTSVKEIFTEERVPLRRDLMLGRSIIDKVPIHIPDVLAESDDEYGAGKKFARKLGFRTILCVPLLSKGEAIGAIAMRREKIAPFNEEEIALAKTFADQAVIAIENARMFKETKEALEQQTATSEILQVISESQTDVQPVFDAIAQNARILTGSTSGYVGLVDGDLLRFGAANSVSAEELEAMRSAFPRPIGRDTAGGRCVLSKSVTYIPDVSKDREYELRIAQSVGYKSIVAVPMIREGKVLGYVVATGAAPEMFTERQIAMLQTFADQAVIAIENTRLFNELEARNRDLTESLERQTATSEILQVISESQTDVHPVYKAIVEKARRLTHGMSAQIGGVEDDLIHFVVADSLKPELVEAFKEAFPRPIGNDTATGRCILSKRATYIPDVKKDPHYVKDLALAGYRSIVTVPMIRESKAIGYISVVGAEPSMFGDRQISMLQTFADQAVIAIENTRLFNELEARNRDLTESLEQQTATAEILQVISGSPTDIQPVLDAISHSAAHLCESNDAQILLAENGELRVASQHGKELADGVGTVLPLSRELAIGNAVIEGRTIHVPDALTLTPGEFDQTRRNASEVGFRCVLAVPLFREGKAIGGVAVRRAEPRPFTERQIALLKTFADQAVIAIENTRLFNELEVRNRDLTEALEYQTATNDILRVISESQTDVQPVFEAIAVNARKLTHGNSAQVGLVKEKLITWAAGDSQTPELDQALKQAFPRPIGNDTNAGRCFLTGKPAYVPDVDKDQDYGLKDTASAGGWRSIVTVPMLLEGGVFGGVTVMGAEPDMFSDRQIALLQTFADQAVIAVKNTRLFNEVQARTRELTEALDRQTATSEILRVISESQTDLQPVFETICTSATRLCDSSWTVFYTYDGQLLHLAACDDQAMEKRLVEENAKSYPMQADAGSAIGRSILMREIAYIPDVLEDEGYRLGQLAQSAGYRSTISVPVLRGGIPIGAISASSIHPRRFTERHITLLKTFADQAVIAIENTRLFNETMEALERETATAEVLKVISSSPTDVTPVFEAIAERARVLCGARVGITTRYDGKQLELIGVDFDPCVPADERAKIRSSFSAKLAHGSMSSRVVLAKAPVKIADVRLDEDYPYKEAAHTVGYRSVLGVPLLSSGEVIGTIVVSGETPDIFTKKFVTLLQTFADQAVIAIQNTRLFNELQS